MILQLASHHCKKIAGFFIVLFYLSIVLSAKARGLSDYKSIKSDFRKYFPKKRNPFVANTAINSTVINPIITDKGKPDKLVNPDKTENISDKKDFIGGPS